jgi:hypothetical protein
MTQGPDISQLDLSELERRVAAAGARFGEMAEESRRRGERLGGLLDDVENGVMRDRLELARLSRALVEAREENAQLLALLERLLAVTERAEGRGEDAMLHDLEARVERLYDQAAARPVDQAASQGANRAADQPEAAARNAGAASDPAAPHVPTHDPAHDPGREGPPWPAISEIDAPCEAPLDLTGQFARPRPRKDQERAVSRVALAESTAVQDIFKRVSLITGRLRET